jgi:hypothetical protein
MGLEDALKRLNKLTREARMVMAENRTVTRNVEEKSEQVIDGAQTYLTHNDHCSENRHC